MKRNFSGHLEDRLLRRELGDSTRYANIHGIYGDKRFVKDFDIVNELKGHTGCVNALSWSTSGKILATGSDDEVINLYSYLPESSSNQFNLTTKLHTGHSRNIFSVKFMPHTNDRKLVSCAGDSQVRIFDIEHGSIVGGERSELGTTSTNVKVFRSHCGSVKRVVTEASPFYFLTCSEDGDVRQWDIRQPESAYPRTRNPYFPSANLQRRDDGPPPLISYQNYNIDLYTISCSPSQPHYIALGGTHLHCFLHDRRMMGRDKLREKGGLLSSSSKSDSSVQAMMEATRCVRKFAPHGRPTMHRTQSAQITACKISNANPNELIVSWSGDHIYGFDIVRDDTENLGTMFGSHGGKSTEKSRKRKRPGAESRGGSQEADARAHTRSRTESSEPMTRPRADKISLLVRLRNGESVEIPLEGDAEDGSADSSSSQLPGEEQARSLRIAQGVTSIKREMFVYHATEDGPLEYCNEDSLKEREDAMVEVVCEAAGVFETIDDAITNWAYPVTHSRSMIAFQQKLRDDRAKAWRFVQAAGTVARVLLKLSPKNNDRELPKSLDYFDMIRPAPRETARPLDQREQFCYDFIKAVLLWLDSGVGAVLREFTADPDDMLRHNPRRQPVTKGAETNAIANELIPYLRHLATEQPVIDVDPSADGRAHVLFPTEVAAVNAFERVVMIPFADLQDEISSSSSEAMARTRLGLSQPRDVAVKYWGMRICRSLLRTAAADVDFACVDSAFDFTMAKESLTDRSKRGTVEGQSSTVRDQFDDIERLHDLVVEESSTDDDAENMAVDTGFEDAEGRDPDDAVGNDPEGNSEDDEDDGEEEEEEEDEEEEEEDEVEEEAWPGARQIVRARRSAGRGVPCSTHSHLYSGHCNVETIKDVNFYGLQDEYVVSGSDCGNLFIWDKRTAGLVTILHGDGEVVNVVQAHPYEPMLAVSGIDHTIKIFSADARARRDAAQGIGISRGDPSQYSTLGLRARRRYMTRPRPGGTTRATSGMSDVEGPSAPPPESADDENDSDAERVEPDRGLPSAKRMYQLYQITSQNDMERKRGSSQYISRSMLALMTARFREHFLALQPGDEEFEEGENVPDVGDDCVVM